MKITDVRTLCLSRPHAREEMWATDRFRVIKADCAIVVITTDAGWEGIGEACAYGWPLRIRDWVQWYAPALIGQDVLDAALTPHPNDRSRAHDCAVAGLDTALWDLRAKIAGKPLCDLLSDQPVRRVRLYASSGCRYDWRERPDQLIAETLGYLASGFTACKMRIGTAWEWDSVTVDRFLGLMREVSQAVSGRMELMVDGNQRLSEDQALPIARGLDRLGFTWFEEPIPQDDIDGYARLNAAVGMPITGGEQFTTLERYRPYLEKHAYAIVQPDVAMCGVTEALKIARMADRYGIDVCPHSWHNGLMAVANGHYVAALPRPRILELCMIQGPLQWAILAEPPVIRDGWLELPQGGGLGVDLATDLEVHFPYIEGSYMISIER